MPRMAGAVGLVAVAILPDQIAGLRIQRLQHHAGVVHVEHAVVHDGRGLVAVARALLHGPAPDQTQVVDVLRGDLIQGAVVGGLVVAANHEPVAGIGIAQHGVGDRNVVLDFTRDGDSTGRLRWRELARRAQRWPERTRQQVRGTLTGRDAANRNAANPL